MQARPTIGLTGGIGSGKSTVAALLGERGAHVIDADKIGHEIYRPGTEGFRLVTDAFGPSIVATDGTIDRRALGAIVFADPDALMRLNLLLHPLIGEAIRARMAAAEAEAARTPVVVEAAIMLEAGWRFFDHLWVVIVQPENAIARVTASRGMSRDEVERRIAAQMSNEVRRSRADLVIENDGTLDALRTQVEAAWRSLGY